MGNTLKQVYASVYIDDNLLQILIGEYFNTRFNIIYSSTTALEGMLNFKIADYKLVVKTIKEQIEIASVKIGATVKKVILVLPAFNFKRFPLRVSVVPSGGILTKKDVARALTSSLRTSVDSNLTIVNAAVIKYLINGISTRRLPEREVCEEVLIDIDLLCADKEMAFEYINAVSDAGLEILDITLNNYSICKEAVLLEQSLSENIILLDISDSHTYMSLLSKGKLVSTEVIYEGLGSIISEIRKTINIPLNDLTRLTVYNVNYESENPDDAVYAWKDEKNISHSINIKELNDCANKPLKAYIERIMQMCTPILEKGKTKFIMTGQGSKMDALAKCLREASKAEVKQYYPDTIGIRDAQMCSVYGSFFAYKEKASLNNLNVSCVDIAEYDSTVDQKKIDVEGETITMKIKKLFEQYRDREEK